MAAVVLAKGGDTDAGSAGHVGGVEALEDKGVDLALGEGQGLAQLKLLPAQAVAVGAGALQGLDRVGAGGHGVLRQQHRGGAHAALGTVGAGHAMADGDAALEALARVAHAHEDVDRLELTAASGGERLFRRLGE